MELGVATAVLSILAGGIAAQWVAWKWNFPALVLLLAIGFVVGPIAGLLHPSAGLGPAFRPIIGLTVAVIVFEGGLALDFRELRSAGGGVLRLTAAALPLNWALGTLAAHFVGRLAWPAAILFGTIIVVTGPTVILPLLRHAKLSRRPASFLKWEAIANDPVGAILTTVVLEVLVASARAPGGIDPGPLAVRVAGGVALSLGLGVGAAFLVSWLFRRDLAPEFLKTPILLALAISVYAVPNLLMAEAGLVGATVFGIVLANLHVPGLAELRRFKEALVVLLVSALFIVLTADLDLSVLSRLSWPIVALTLSVLLVVRPVATLLATVGSDASWQERTLVGWIAPRGIVAAAVSGLAGVRLGEAGFRGAELIQPTVFAVIALTVVLHGFTLRPLARRLGLTASDAPTLAVLGASDWTVDLAKTVTQAGTPTILIDTFPGALDTARAEGLPTIQAELLSRHAEAELVEQPIDYLVAATPDPIYNALVCARLAPELGRERVYQVAPGGSQMVDPESGMSRDWRGKILAEEELDFPTYGQRFAQGWRFLAVEAGDPEPSAHGIPLLLVRQGGGVDFLSADHAHEVVAAPGDRWVRFAPPEATRQTSS